MLIMKRIFSSTADIVFLRLHYSRGENLSNTLSPASKGDKIANNTTLESLGGNFK